MSSRVAIERVATLDAAMFAHCDFGAVPSVGAYPFDSAFATPKAARLLAILRLDGRIAGYVACQRERDAGEVRRLEIDSATRGQGLGRRLLDEARGWAGEQGLFALRLETLANNPAASRFFSRHGFSLTRALDTLHWHLPLRP